MAERSYRPLLLVLALVGLTLDQATKYGVFAWLGDRPGDMQTVSPKTYVLFRTVPDARIEGFSLVAADYVNQGALFGWKGNIFGWQILPPGSSNYFFAIVSLLAAIGIVAWSFLPSTGRDRLLCAALGLILAGTLGNFYDRMVFQGVRDFLHWNYLFDWAVFNVADCCLVCGAGLMLVQAFLLKPAVEAKVPETAGTIRPIEPDKRAS